MEKTSNQALAYALRRLLRPLVRLLLRNGITCNEFCELAKQSYVETALSDFREPGRKATDSRAAVVTGLNRKEVRRLRSVLDANTLTKLAVPPARGERVVSGWLRDPDFLDSNGRPKTLAFDGPDSFSELVRRYSGDLPPRAILNELKRVSVADESSHGVALLKFAYVPEGDPEHLLRILGADVADLIQTIDHNLVSRDETHTPRFQRTLRYSRIPRAILPDWQAVVEDEGQALLQRLNTWLSRHDADVSGDIVTDPVTTGLGLFYLESSPGADASEPNPPIYSPTRGNPDETD